MGEFIDVVLDFPTVLFSFPLLVVAGFWALALAGAAEIGLLDADVEADAGAGAGVEDGGTAGPLAAAGLAGVPATVTVSLLVVLAWFASLTGSVLVDGVGGSAVHAALSVAVLVAALTAAWLATRLAASPLRRVFESRVEASLRDFVGLACVIRTGRVGPDFGQAEVTAADGSSATVQVRRPPMDVPVAGAAAGTATGLTAGDLALIFDFDPAGEFFWVMPYDAALAPEPPPR